MGFLQRRQPDIHQEGLRRPRKSPLFDLLKKSPDQTVAKLAERLEEYCTLPVENVQDLETILHGIPPTPAPSPSAVPSTAVRGYRQALQARQPVQPASTATQSHPPAPKATKPVPSAQPAAAPTTQAAANPAPGVSRRAAPGEIRKVLLGVTVTVAAVTMALAAMIVWAISVRGWYD